MVARGLVLLGWLALSCPACRSGKSVGQQTSSKVAASASASASSSAPPASAPQPSALAPTPATSAAKEAASAAPKKDSWPTRFEASGRGFEGTSAEPLPGTAKSIVCSGRSPCRVLWEKPAGYDEKKRAMAVTAISLRAKSREQGDPDRLTECEPIEYWLLRREKRSVLEAELLLEVCNDGYGASGVGEDVIEVGENSFKHEQMGGSAWRWNERSTVQLSPRKVLEQGDGGYWSPGLVRWGKSWDWLRFSGHGEYLNPPCDANGQPSEQADASADMWLPIPQVHVEPDFLADGWKHSALGACSARVAGADDTGFVVHGKQSGPSDGSLRVVQLEDHSFVVELRDDHFVLSAKRPLFEDHLEIWSSNAEQRVVGTFCQSTFDDKPKQWGVRLEDGAVWSGFGAPETDRVHVELGGRDGGAVRLRVRLVDAAPFVSFVYSDSDDGVSQKSLIATSSVRFGKSHSLGETLPIDAGSATCAVRDGRLEPVLK